MEYPDRRSAAGARGVIANLQQRVVGWIDGDRVLPADGSFLLAMLEQAREGLAGSNPLAAQQGIKAFMGRVQSLIEEGALPATDDCLSLEAARALLAPDS